MNARATSLAQMFIARWGVFKELDEPHEITCGLSGISHADGDRAQAAKLRSQLIV